MPWKEIKPMEQKIHFISDYLRGHTNVSELCQRYGISRKTGYKWIERFKTKGLDGLYDQSRRPHRNPAAIPYGMRKAIIELRRETKSTPGAKKLLTMLSHRFPNEALPSQTTIYNILKREGLIEVQRRKRRVTPYEQPFDEANEPNDVWSTDFKGQFKVGTGHWCYPLTVMDHSSRYLLDCHALRGTKTLDTKRIFVRLFKDYGLPKRIRSDNGVPFASNATGGLSQLSVWWIKLGILPERIAPGKPQQNGRHERMHRTLKKATARPAAHSLKAQQKRFDAFRQEYNEQRPHEALNQQTPQTHYKSSRREYPNKLPKVDYPDYYEKRRVRKTGVVYWGGGQVYVSHLLANETVGMEEIDDGLWDIYFGPIRLGGFNVRDKKGGVVSYWTLKV